MKAFDTSRLPINPSGLKGVSTSYGLGFFPGLGTILGAVKDGLTMLGDFILSSADGAAERDAHIAAQNEAIDGMAAIATTIDNFAAQGMLTADLLTQAQQGMRDIALEFDAFAQRVGTDRARRGSAEITALANSFITDWERAKATYFGGQPTVPVPTVGPGGGGTGPSPSVPTVPSPYSPSSPWTPAPSGGIGGVLESPLLKWGLIGLAVWKLAG